MYNRKYILGIVVLFLMIGIGFVGAIPPVTTTQSFSEGYLLDIPANTHWKLNTDHLLPVYVKNISNGNRITGTDADCVLRLFSGNGTSLLYMDAVIHSLHYDFTINKGNFSTAGTYFYSVNCNGSSLAGYYSQEIEVTESGIEITESRSILTIGLLSLLIFLLFISLYSMFNIEHYIGKFTLYWISHILLILISFISWQIGVEGLLGGMALTGIFRIMFWIFLIAVIPMIISSVAWIVYIYTYNEHFQKLIEKGCDTEEAFRIIDKKKGWFNGN